MKSVLLLLLLAILSRGFTLAYAQEVLVGKVTSCRDKKPLAFANIVLTKNLSGTISDENGEFRLSLQSANADDSIAISYVGFKTVKEPVSVIVKNGAICLEEFSVMLNEVIVSSKQLDHTKLFEKFRSIRGNLHAQESETSIAEFNLFLKEIKGTPSFEKYNYYLTGYSGATKEFYERYHANTLEPKHRGKNWRNGEENYAHYPVINITHEAAVAYCQWMTDEYNNQKKRKFKKVKFRLPTINEWQIAALGYAKFESWNLDENLVEVRMPSDSVTEVGIGKRLIIKASDIDYPWYGSYNYRRKTQNHKHCFLGNFKVPETYIPCMIPKFAGDGYSMMGHVAVYFPNDIGLFDVVGNVAEMIDQNGKACGGSWNQLPIDCTIRSITAYNMPNSWVGFRVFMEVIEER